MRTFAILPVKRFEAAKQRLSGAVAPPSRRAALARAMVADVLDALAACVAIERTIVVTADARARALAHGHAATVLPDPREDGQSAAARLGIAHALAEGCERVVCVPGDCPALDAYELQEMLASAPAGALRSVAIVPDRHGTGTNALVLTPPDAIAPAFGPGSFERHRALAAAAAARCEVRELRSLLLDIDTSEDLAVLRERLAREEHRAPRTRELLAIGTSAPADGR